MRRCLSGFLRLYFALASLGCYAWAQSPGVITTIAGNAQNAGDAGDNGPAIAATLTSPQAVAFDGAGNLYIGDNGTRRVRKIDTSGVITAFAGNGTNGDTGDLGPAVNAQFKSVSAIAVDKTSGNVYIADQIANRVRVVTPDGIIHAFAGDGNMNFNGDGGPAVNAEISWPIGLAVDASGNVYIASSMDYRIRKVATNGIITTFAGTGANGSTGDGSAATSATLAPYGLAFDSAGNLFVADDAHYVVRKIDTTGYIWTVAGNGSSGYSGDGGPATAAGLSDPWSVAVDASGNLFIADRGANTVRMVDTSGNISTPIGQTNSVGYAGDGGPANLASLYLPTGVATDANGNVVIADMNDHVIREVLRAISVDFGSKAVGQSTGYQPVTVVSATGTVASFRLMYGTDFDFQPPSCDPAHLQCAVAFHPVYPGLRRDALLALDSNGNVIGTEYLTGTGQGAQLSVTPGILGHVDYAGAAITSYSSTFDSAGNFYWADAVRNAVVKMPVNGVPADVPTPGVTLSMPWGIAVDGAGTIYIVDNNNHRIVKIGADGTVSTVTSTANLFDPRNIVIDAKNNLYVSDRGAHCVFKIMPDGSSSTISLPGSPSAVGLALDSNGNLYVGDINTGSIYKVDPSGNVSTLAVTGVTVSQPNGLATDAAGDVYVADGSNNQIVEIKPDGTAVPVAGNTSAGDSPDGVSATEAQISAPQAVAIAPDGSLYFADSGNTKIRTVLNPNTVTFPNTNVGQTSSFVGTLQNIGNAPVTFPSSLTSVSNSGVFTLPSGNCYSFLGSAFPAGTSCGLVAQFQPTTAGPVTDQIVLTPPLQIVLSGVGTGTPQLTAAPTSLSFGNQALGTSTTLTVSLTNTGSAAFSGFNYKFEGANASDFAGNSTCGSNIAVGATCSISVTFTPSVSGPETAILGFIGQVVTVPLLGTGVSAPNTGNLSLSTTSLNFGNQTVGVASAAQQVTLTNTGTGALTLSDTFSTGTDVRDFSLSGSCAHATLAPGASCQTNVVFTPSRTGSESATFNFNTVQGGVVPLSLSGTGVATSPVPTGTIEILSVGSGKALDVTGESNQNGAPIQQYEYWGGDNQHWQAVPVDGGYYKIVSISSGKVLDVTNYSTENGGLIQQWDYRGGDNQKWQILVNDDGSYRIISKQSGKALDVTDFSTENGGLIQQWDYLGGSNQKWQIRAVQYVTITSQMSGKVLDDMNYSTENGTLIQQWDNLLGANQQWELIPTGSGYYRIMNRMSGKVLDVTNFSTENGALIQQWDYLGGDNQQWKLVANPDGSTRILNKASSKALDMYNWSLDNGGLLQQWDYLGGGNQNWVVANALPL